MGVSESHHSSNRSRRNSVPSARATTAPNGSSSINRPQVKTEQNLINAGANTTQNNVDSKGNMPGEDIAAKVETLDLNDKKEINILLVGETGVGKSTFINSIFNYLQFHDFTKAEKEHLNILIPTSFTIQDKSGVMRNVEVGSREDENEVLITGSSATQAVKTYSFRINGGQTLIRIFDTPGIGDTRGVTTDEDNWEKTLQCISRFHNLHAICYLTKTQQSRSTVYFNYCVSQILSRLEKSACKNIVFVFTHSRGSNYSPGETLQLLRQVTENIKKKPANAEIPLKHNVFCFDNEAFRSLAAIKNGVELSSEVRRRSIDSWNRSTKQCWEMLSYIQDLPPHVIHRTSAINEIRRIIYQLAQSMADIAELINDNNQILQSYQSQRDINYRSLTELRKKLFIPAIDLKVTKLPHPVLVCGDLSCCETYDVGGRNEWHYKTICHVPCYLASVPSDIMGAPGLMDCEVMGPTHMCTKCTHSYKVHLIVYYMTEKIHTKRKDEVVSSNINSLELETEKTRKKIKDVEEWKKQHEAELKTIIECNAKFAHFLTNNGIAPFNDSYAEYIEYLMIGERSLGSHADISKLAGLQRLLRKQNEMIKLFAEALESQKKMGKANDLTRPDIDETMQELFKLPVNGKKIKELHELQTKSTNKEFSEYVHEAVFQQSSTDLEKNQDQIKDQSLAANPTAKSQQRGRPNNRGNNNNQQRRRGRGRSAGPHNRNRSERSPPPTYDEARDHPRYPIPNPLPNYPPDYREQSYPHPDGQQYHAAPPPPQLAGAPKPDAQTIQLNVTLPMPPPCHIQTNHPSIPPLRDYQLPGNYPPIDPHYSQRNPYPPRDSYPPRDPYPPRESYPPRDAYPLRDPYPTRDPYPSWDPYVSRGPYPPSDSYRPGDRYAHHHTGYHGRGLSTSHHPPPVSRGHGANNYPRQDNNNRYQNNNRGRNNHRGNRKYKKKGNNKANSNGGDDSDTSVASSKK